MAQDEISKKVELNWLSAFYGGLLTDKQRQVLTLHCEEDLSLTEIAQEVGISRQGVHDTLARAEQLLEGYLDIKKPLSDSEVTLTAAEVKRLIRAVDPTGDDLLQRKLLQLDEANAELEALKEERKVLLAGRKVEELTRDEQFELAQNRNRTETQKGKMLVNRIQRVARNNIS